MSISRYEIYKDSEINWLGEIPSHWDIKKMRHIVNGGLMNGLFKKKEDFGSGVKLINVFDVYQGNFTINAENLDRVLATPLEQGKYKVEAGDIFFVRSSLKLEGVGCSVCALAVDEPMVFECHIVRARPKEFIRPKYLINFLNSSVARGKLVSDANIVTMATIGQDKIKNLEVLVPPLEEQDRIIAFLDRKTSEIDQAIAQKQRLIELLQEQKAILINRAVTKGLNPNAPMRDSGVEWIGGIPKHWSVKRIGFLANLLQTGPFGSQLHQEEYIEGGIPVINPSQLIDGAIKPDYKISVSEKTVSRLERHQLVEGDIVLGRRGEMGRCGLVRSKEVGWLCGTGSLLFRPKTELINPEFALVVLGSVSLKATLEYISVGATMDNLNTAILSKVPLAIPPLKEQEKIIDEVKNIEASFSNLVSYELHGIDLLNELSQVVIAHAVTGKIKV